MSGADENEPSGLPPARPVDGTRRDELTQAAAPLNRDQPTVRDAGPLGTESSGSREPTISLESGMETQGWT